MAGLLFAVRQAIVGKTRETTVMLDKKDVAVWLAGHGFETEDGSNFVAPIPNGKFEIELSDAWARSVVTSDTVKYESKRTSYRVLAMDTENDTLHGLSLYTTFARETFDGTEPPVWFSRQMIDALRPRAEEAPARMPGRR